MTKDDKPIQESEMNEGESCRDLLWEYSLVHRFKKDQVLAKAGGIVAYLEKKADLYQEIADAYMTYIKARAKAAGREDTTQKEQDHYWTLSNIPATLRKAADEKDPEEIELVLEALEEANLDVAHLVKR